MGKRNVLSYLEKADKKLQNAPQYSMSTSEVEAMIKDYDILSGDSLINLIIKVYDLGFETGTRYEKNRIKKS